MWKLAPQPLPAYAYILGCAAGEADALEASAADLGERISSAKAACLEVRASGAQASKRLDAAISAHDKALR